MKYLAVLFVFGIFFAATPAYALERGTGSYIDYLILKMQSQGASASASTSVAPTTDTPTTGGTYSFQSATPNAIVNWLQSVRTFSVPTINVGSSFGGGSSIDVTTYHLIGDPNEGLQNTRGIAD